MEAETAQLQRRNRELAILNTIAEALNRTQDLDHALRATLAHTVALFDLRTGWIWLLNEHTGAPYLAAAQHLPPALANEPTRMEGSCYCLDTYRAGDLNGAANINVVTCSRLKGLADGTDGLRFHASIPLHAHGKQLGVLNVGSGDWRELSPDDLRLLHTVGDLLGSAVDRARLFAHSAQLGAAEERNRLAREIHDTLAQGMAAVTLQLETADALLEAGGDQERVRRVVQRALHLTRANLHEARRSVGDLRATPLEGRTLAQALPALLEQIGHGHPIATACTISGGDQPLPVALAAGLYRIAQEALTNAVRHAAAAHLAVRLAVLPNRVELAVEDDGRGFVPSAVPAGHFGLVGLHERARLLGGTLQLCTAPGEGTSITVAVPLERTL